MEHLAISIITFLATLIGTLTGFGSSIFMIPILLLWLPLTQTILIAGIVHLFVQVWKVLLFRTHVRWKLIVAFSVPGSLATYLGANVMSSAPTDLLTQLMGVLLIFYALYVLKKPTFKVNGRKPLAVTAGLSGAISGFSAGLTGIGGPLRAAALTIFHLPKEAYIAATGSIGLIIDITRITTYINNGYHLSTPFFYGMTLYIPITFVGAIIARSLVETIPQRKFRSVVAVFLVLIGAKLVVFPT